MDLSKKEKLAKLAKLSQPERKNARWKEIAQWNLKHADSLEDYAIIAGRILECLKAKDMTQKQLAEQLAVSPQALTRIVKGRQNLSLQTIRRVEKVLDIQLVSVVKQTKPILKINAELIHIETKNRARENNFVLLKDYPMTSQPNQVESRQELIYA